MRTLCLLVLASALIGGCRPPAGDPAANAGSGSGGSGAAPAEGSAAFVPTVDATAAANGERLYAQYCALCHGANGEGYLADNANQLNNPVFLSLASDEFIAASIKVGRPGTPMSAWHQSAGGPLTDADVNDITAHIRSWQTQPTIELGTQPIPGSIVDGERLYKVHCTACHGERGEGGTAPRIGNAAFLSLVSDHYLERSISLGRPGTTMPAFTSVLADNEINDIVAYLRSLQAPFQQQIVAGDFKADYSRAVINPGAPAATFELREDRFVAADAVKAALDAGQSMVIIDARATSDYLNQHIAGAVSVPYYDLERAAAELPRDVFIIAYCGCPHAASGRAVDSLRAAGFTQTAVLDEGINYWIQHNYPLSSGDPSNPGAVIIAPVDPHAGHNHPPIGGDPHAGHNHPPIGSDPALPPGVVPGPGGVQMRPMDAPGVPTSPEQIQAPPQTH